MLETRQLVDTTGLLSVVARPVGRFALALLRYGWALPNTLIGLLFIPFAIQAQSRLRIVDGVIEVHAPLLAALLQHWIPIHGGAAAMSFGHIVIGRDSESLDAARRHERVHVRQCETWGPAFIPAYLIAGLWALITGKSAYEGNYFECQARYEFEADGLDGPREAPGADHAGGDAAAAEPG